MSAIDETIFNDLNPRTTKIQSKYFKKIILLYEYLQSKWDATKYAVKNQYTYKATKSLNGMVNRDKYNNIISIFNRTKSGEFLYASDYTVVIDYINNLVDDVKTVKNSNSVQKCPYFKNFELQKTFVLPTGTYPKRDANGNKIIDPNTNQPIMDAPIPYPIPILDANGQPEKWPDGDIKYQSDVNAKDQEVGSGIYKNICFNPTLPCPNRSKDIIQNRLMRYDVKRTGTTVLEFHECLNIYRTFEGYNLLTPSEQKPNHVEFVYKGELVSAKTIKDLLNSLKFVNKILDEGDQVIFPDDKNDINSNTNVGDITKSEVSLIHGPFSIPRCVIGCLVACQNSCQHSCQHCYNGTCHHQNCGGWS